MNVIQWSDDLVIDLENSIYIENHPIYPAYFLVNGDEDVSLLDLKDRIENKDGTAVFIDDPTDVLQKMILLDEPYPYNLFFDLKGFQLQGFNYVKDLPSCMMNWSTGTGKTLLAVARTKYLLETGKVDKVIIMSKNHNKTNWKRSLKNWGYLNSVIDEEGKGSNAKERRKARLHLYKSSQIIILNYEKLRILTNSGGDAAELEKALKNKKVLWVWDELPNKMKSMSTGHYRGAVRIMHSTKINYQMALTGTKIETDPENLYTCMKLLDPTIWRNKDSFRKMYAKTFNPFNPWEVETWDMKKLPDMGKRIAHITHIANKYTDPKISAEFPEEHWDDILIDMSPQDRKLYKITTDSIVADLTDDFDSILNRLSVLQMICDNPDSVNRSQGLLAQQLTKTNIFSDKYCSKLDTLKEMINSIDGKIVLFSMYNEYGAKMLIPYLAKWNIPFVLYDGAKKQWAEDQFRTNPHIKLFVSSDQGSDSINLEKATTVINYNLPWNYSTLIQRVNRINRISSQADHVFYYNLIMSDTIEERKLAILNRKKAYESGIDSGLVQIEDVTDLRWILTG